jgi:hypothetical protein
LTEAARTPVQALRLIESYLRQRPYDLSSRPGHTYAALARVLPGTARADQGVTDEQTAGAFAVMARSLGYPARVAVGYQLDQKDIGAGTFPVTTQRAYAWPEVLFDHLGWVSFDPTGKRRKAPPEQTRAPSRPEAGTDRVPQTVAAQQEARAGEQGPQTAFGGGLAGRTIGWLLVAAALLVSSVAAVVGGKVWRRQRRRFNGAPADRVTAAWRESTDRLREHGLDVPMVLTTEEVADRAGARFGLDTGGSVAMLAPLVTAAVFAPEEPEEDTAEQAWQLERELRDLLDGQRSLLQRGRAWLDPRPLLPRRRAALGDRGWHDGHSAGHSDRDTAESP